MRSSTQQQRSASGCITCESLPNCLQGKSQVAQGGGRRRAATTKQTSACEASIAGRCALAALNVLSQPQSRPGRRSDSPKTPGPTFPCGGAQCSHRGTLPGLLDAREATDPASISKTAIIVVVGVADPPASTHGARAPIE